MAQTVAVSGLFVDVVINVVINVVIKCEELSHGHTVDTEQTIRMPELKATYGMAVEKFELAQINTAPQPPVAALQG